jgi:hypothetical protein
MKIQFVMKKVEGNFEAALVVDGRFQRAVSNASVEALVTSQLLPVLRTAQNSDEGVTVSFDINIDTGEPDAGQGR